MTLADDLAALIAAREAATKGPWTDISAFDMAAVSFGTGETGEGYMQVGGWDDDAIADAAFIALAANVIEAHGAELAALVAENARLRAALTDVAEAGHATAQIGGPHDGLKDWAHCEARGCRIARAALRGPS